MKNCLIAFFSLLFFACNQPAATNTATTDTAGASPKTFSPANIEEQVIYGRALNAVVWGMPAVNFQLFIEALNNAKGDYNQVVYWSGLMSSKNQTLTPNPNVIYISPFYDTRKGPVVLEIPPAAGPSSITGSVDDGWQTAIEDVGPAGVDKGKGGKYLILPPGYKDKIPAGYFPMPSSVYTGFALLRSNLTDGGKEDIARAVEYGKLIKIYPFTLATKSAQTTFVDLLNVDYNTTIPYNLHFFELLNEFVQREPWLTRDMAMIDQLKSLGIEKGKPFQPDEQTKKILNSAISDAHRWIVQKTEQLFVPPFYEGTHWALPANPELAKGIMSNYADSQSYATDWRAVSYSLAFFSSKHLGAGQYYLMTIKDNKNQPFYGSKTYQLHIPPNVPVKLYWSVTAYDGETHALIRNVPYSSRASTTPGITKNADGSFDLYFGPKAPAGKESNWVPTDPARPFELLTRFYGPEKGFFEKAWKMGDAEEVK